ncbi:GNAT family N-acetyltransferase [Mesotoga sp. H07.pep.5.3]|uniref:GNAT family N-acetyltransferase n=1 Tax=Mesotoga sp. H07.pep.5.3 TaxID=1421003 RepID=UPI000C1A124B|nr:GNAT family N-acetyltransferase [Mesotoga sp. H07.pep.5.3]PIJ62112.1 acetyltransferase [Mesotoga sp. H07.pep.5.3]
MKNEKIEYRQSESSDLQFVAHLVFNTDPSHFRRALGRKALAGISRLLIMGSAINLEFITVCEIGNRPIAIYAFYTHEEMNRLARVRVDMINFSFSIFGFRLLQEFRTLQRSMEMGVFPEQKYLGLISVHEDFRNKGYGRRILNHLLEMDAEIVLDVSRWNRKAISLYSECGFEFETNLPSNYPTKDSIRMKSTRDHH